MEAAAETVRHLTRTILPERPHQLSQSPDWKLSSDHHTKRWEEREHSRLQYMTLVTEADRGVLFARGYYDIRPEPPRPVPREVNVLARGGAKKLSLSDYNKKKTGATTSTSPPEASPSQNQKKPTDRPAPPSEPKLPEDSRRPGSKLGDVESRSSSKNRSALNEPGVDSNLPPKPASLPPRPPSPDRRKRASDTEDASRPPKRTKPLDGSRVGDERAAATRDDPPSRKVPDVASSRDSLPSKDGKSTKASLLPNGRNILKSATTSTTRPLSPPPRSRDTNGTRPNTQEGSRGGSIKVDVSSKHSIPPLLSPLRIDIEGNKDASARRGEKKSRDANADGVKGAKPKATDTQSLSRRPKSPTRLPPLLSPTLPPEIEAELELRKKGSPRTVEARPAADLSESTKRPRAETVAEDTPEPRGRKIVTLIIPKGLRQRFIALMKPETTMSRKGLRQDRPTGLGGVAASDKRPVGVIEASSDSLATKRPRTSDMMHPARLPPSTPSKKGAPAMSRVSSSGSLARTPGDAANVTPSVPPSSDRIVNGPESTSRINWTKLQNLKELENTLNAIGRRLKHKGDLSMKGRLEQHTSANGNVRASEDNIKLGYVLILESTIAFMMAFHAQDTHRTMAAKVSDHNTWQSLFPLLDFLQKDMRRLEVRRMRPLFTISMVLQVFAYDEMLRAQSTHENPPNLTLQDILKSRRSRDRLISQIRDTTAVMESNMCINVTLLTTVEEVADMAMQILRRWCTEERIDYTAELNLKEISIKSML